MPTQVGYLRAAEMILLGEPFSAACANELGLVTAVVADQHVWDKASGVATNLARKPAEGLRACKKLIKASDQDAIRQAVSRELSEFAARVVQQVPCEAPPVPTPRGIWAPRSTKWATRSHLFRRIEWSSPNAHRPF